MSLGLEQRSVRVVASFSAYCDRVSERFGIDFHPEFPYKLGDIKPALGFVHQEELQGIDFWGFGDIDVIYGNPGAYFTTKKLCSKD
ncbi:DUF6625 family protein [Stutzerimonas tarimensis]|uniref:DUF6625 family protein n=1 Tax=Stutzerimonas tarimensis TaxID=1507735 RepID=A0ABV7T7Y0_9GAMM